MDAISIFDTVRSIFFDRVTKTYRKRLMTGLPRYRQYFNISSRRIGRVFTSNDFMAHTISVVCKGAVLRAARLGPLSATASILHV